MTAYHAVKKLWRSGEKMAKKECFVCDQCNEDNDGDSLHLIVKGGEKGTLLCDSCKDDYVEAIVDEWFVEFDETESKHLEMIKGV